MNTDYDTLLSALIAINTDFTVVSDLTYNYVQLQYTGSKVQGNKFNYCQYKFDKSNGSLVVIENLTSATVACNCSCS